MDSGITKIELIPSIDDADIRPRLASSVKRARLARASVAYWTAPYSKVASDLPKRLAGPGFLCVDIHLPTDLNELMALHTAGAAVHVHLKQVRGNAGERTTGMPPHLLHTKMFLLEFRADEAELWIGSHNWTLRALAGPNVECSLILTMPRKHQIYADARQFLEQCRALCSPFDPARLAEYKLLQAGQDKDPVIELEGKNVARLEHSVIAIYGTDQRDYRELDTVGRDVAVEISDSDTGRPYLYSANIISASLGEATNPNAAGHVVTTPLRYAFREGRRLAVLRPAAIPPASVGKAAEYWALVELDELLRGMRAYDPVAEKRWVPVKHDKLLERTAPDVRERLLSGRRPPISVPTDFGESGAHFHVETLEEKRAASDRPMVSRKIIAPLRLRE